MSLDTTAILYLGAGGLMLIGIAGVVLNTHLVRIIFGLALLEAGANLLLLLASFREGTVAPIIVDGSVAGPMADPVPQALVLTAIVIGVGVLALALALVLRLYRAWGSLDIREIRHRMEQAIAAEARVAMPYSAEAPELPVTPGEAEQ
jgi:multicomponent Na+:H+ antiporter subunit C